MSSHCFGCDASRTIRCTACGEGNWQTPNFLLEQFLNRYIVRVNGDSFYIFHIKPHKKNWFSKKPSNYHMRVNDCKTMALQVMSEESLLDMLDDPGRTFEIPDTSLNYKQIELIYSACKLYS